ncbi:MULTISPECIES: type 1 glutamine amidotransferase domain-containing protein [Streptomyces]|uniref:Type 1 glutamine amidotransferase domain-containing protein n=1 Tax=Streptomyces doudnae TaxID=3075536 RepID=A0ABD5EL68_9ACTN|nr:MULTISPECIES: type 1 glutamine amidotransferase domain-containing protein [unclassified Streptomyces]MDT0434804.1 type 1 glutamine amidotransferase domain-containing protein [Streptomyces sp. DSM 41981]MYQ68840.1 DJ-1/PfpI/YhbO family deglycase/protease [Streptomyces sp. SID4950]SCE49455.1 protease I [Streptomyces sp. SolWspMP-5a-2]
MADKPLNGHRVLVLVTQYGVEQDELVVPVTRLREDGADVTVAAPTTEPVQTLVGDKDPGETVRPDTVLDAVDPLDHQLLLLPGGTLNADQLRLDETALGLVTAFAGSGRPIAAICHGPWALVETGLVRGRTLTSYPSLRTDILNAGAASWVDEPVVSDDTGGCTLVTSRTPKDLDAFLDAVGKALVGS